MRDSLPVSASPGDAQETAELSRRHVLGLAVSTPMVPAGLGLAAAPGSAVAAPLPLTPADPTDAVEWSGGELLCCPLQDTPALGDKFWSGG